MENRFVNARKDGQQEDSLHNFSKTRELNGEESLDFSESKSKKLHTAPTLRMETVRDGLYFIHFQPPLSALQSFSIAVAIIYIRSSTLRPKKLRELK
ncbi:hypothetical protein CMV_007670 [Castanea mollissima]|uniref:Uncharacterized protein n=1 Tax=Castanea mollissima TaxID=60419 RepID=A0A8J4RMU0_9ROSI|nr:hypothetical protein CMV_007670 [Castanea mollissima]